MAINTLFKKILIQKANKLNADIRLFEKGEVESNLVLNNQGDQDMPLQSNG